MTVRNYNDETTLICEWFTEKQYFSKDFHQDSLKAYESKTIVGPIYSSGRRTPRDAR